VKQVPVQGMCVGHAMSWGTFVNGRKLWWGFVGGGLLSRVFTVDERHLEHPHVCHCAKFEQSHNPCPSYSNLVNLTWSPPTILDIRAGHTWTTPHVVGPHFLCTHHIW